MRVHLGSLELQHGLALGFPPRRLLILLQGQVGVRGSTCVGISRTLREREREMQRFGIMKERERERESKVERLRDREEEARDERQDIQCIHLHPAGLQTTLLTRYAHYYKLCPQQIQLGLGKLEINGRSL